MTLSLTHTQCRSPSHSLQQFTHIFGKLLVKSTFFQLYGKKMKKKNLLPFTIDLTEQVTNWNYHIGALNCRLLALFFSF